MGGFFVRDPYRPLGEVWTDGRACRHEPVPEPYAPRRACVVSDGDGVRIVARDDAPERPDGDLLQAGPLLVADGAVAFDPRGRPRGLLAPASGQFDSDITDGRHPRAALGRRRRRAHRGGLRRAPHGRRRRAVDAGARRRSWSTSARESAINLDGGGSTTLVHRGHLLNRPYSDQDQPAPQSRRVVTALALEPVADARAPRGRGLVGPGRAQRVALAVAGVLPTPTTRVFASDGFADRAAATLDAAPVRDAAARRLTDAVVGARPDLVALRPIVELGARAVVGTAQFRSLVRRAALDAHRSAFDAHARGRDPADPRRRPAARRRRRAAARRERPSGCPRA